MISNKIPGGGMEPLRGPRNISSLDRIIVEVLDLLQQCFLISDQFWMKALLPKLVSALRFVFFYNKQAD